MPRMLLPASLCSLMLLMTGCVNQGQYQWGHYEGNLYGYYKSPDKQDILTNELGEDLATAEAAGKVPPGLYAEYGFLLLKQGKDAEARRYFEKEQEKWPESRTFMSTLLKGTNPGKTGN